MAWTASAMFREWPRSILGAGQTADVLPSGYAGLAADTIKAALFNNTPTPNKDATRANTGLGVDQWVIGNQVTDTNWPSGGIALTSKTLTTPSTGVFQFDAADTTHTGTVTLANVYGALLYDDTIAAGTGGVADQGIAYHYLGGAQSVTAGEFTVIWHANGIFRMSV